MLSRRLSFGTALSALVISMQATAQAQFYNGGCGCGAVAAAPIAQCTPIQPVQATCYQTVPVTTFTREKQTVEVPTYETAYEDREVTVYRPVTQNREVEVPTVSYQNVTEYRTVNRDMGRWITRYHPVAKYSPCQVDPRPGVIGWMNRTGYSMRTAFMPNYTTSRQYVPNMVSCNVPYTRQVAIQGTRRVTVQETKMVAERKTERIPVQKLVMKKEEVTVMRPQTAYRTVPIGTQTAYGMPYIGGSQFAYGGYLIDNTRTAAAPSPDPAFGEGGRTTFREDSSDPKFERSAKEDETIRGSSLERTPLPADEEPAFPASTRRGSDRDRDNVDSRRATPASYRKQAGIETATAKPSSANSGWRAARKSTETAKAVADEKPTISVAGTEVVE
ncbi:MAG: hypothetical protein ACK58L_07440 [Planctomycetota bacterium]